MYSLFERPKAKSAPCGSPEAVTYSLKIDKYGAKKLEATGKTNVYELIQADAESCKIENILRRVTEGDFTAFRSGEMMFADTTEMPKTLAEAQNLVIQANEEFSKLPKEVREKFGNSASAYIAEMGTKTWASKIGMITEREEEAVKEVKEEVKANE